MSSARRCVHDFVASRGAIEARPDIGRDDHGISKGFHSTKANDVEIPKGRTHGGKSRRPAPSDCFITVRKSRISIFTVTSVSYADFTIDYVYFANRTKQSLNGLVCRTHVGCNGLCCDSLYSGTQPSRLPSCVSLSVPCPLLNSPT